MDVLSKRNKLKQKLSKDKRDVLLVTNTHNERRIEDTTHSVIDIVSGIARCSRTNIAGETIQVARGY